MCHQRDQSAAFRPTPRVGQRLCYAHGGWFCPHCIDTSLFDAVHNPNCGREAPSVLCAVRLLYV